MENSRAIGKAQNENKPSVIATNRSLTPFLSTLWHRLPGSFSLLLLAPVGLASRWSDADVIRLKVRSNNPRVSVVHSSKGLSVPGPQSCPPLKFETTEKGAVALLKTVQRIELLSRPVLPSTRRGHAHIAPLPFFLSPKKKESPVLQATLNAPVHLGSPSPLVSTRTSTSTPHHPSTPAPQHPSIPASRQPPSTAWAAPRRGVQRAVAPVPSPQNQTQKVPPSSPPPRVCCVLVLVHDLDLQPRPPCTDLI